MIRFLKERWFSVILITMLLTGIGLLLYPTVSDFWNNRYQSRLIASYDDMVQTIDAKEQDAMLHAAETYNENLLKRQDRFSVSKDQLELYNRLLNPGKDGIMGTIQIESLQIHLPIFHGVEEKSLQSGAGHLNWSSLPVGGEGTHAVISGHRGLPSSLLFTDLDRMVEGDIFQISVLNRTLTYQVDQIRIVLPDEVDELEIQAGKDYCTLVTCTPYGVNTHRILIRGHRIENPEELLRIEADGRRIESYKVAPVLAAPVLLILMLAVFLRNDPRSIQKKQSRKQLKASLKKIAEQGETEHTEEPEK